MLLTLLPNRVILLLMMSTMYVLVRKLSLALIFLVVGVQHRVMGGYKVGTLSGLQHQADILLLSIDRLLCTVMEFLKSQSFSFPVLHTS